MRSLCLSTCLPVLCSNVRTGWACALAQFVSKKSSGVILTYFLTTGPPASLLEGGTARVPSSTPCRSEASVRGAHTCVNKGGGSENKRRWDSVVEDWLANSAFYRSSEHDEVNTMRQPALRLSPEGMGGKRAAYRLARLTCRHTSRHRAASSASHCRRRHPPPPPPPPRRCHRS